MQTCVRVPDQAKLDHQDSQRCHNSVRQREAELSSKVANFGSQFVQSPAFD